VVIFDYSGKCIQAERCYGPCSSGECESACTIMWLCLDVMSWPDVMVWCH